MLRADQRIVVMEVYSGPSTGAEDTRGLQGRLAAEVQARAPGAKTMLLDLGELDARLADAGTANMASRT